MDTPAVIRPDEACVYCAEKHLAAAYALARENGYEAVNRAWIVGQLVLAQWHLWQTHRDVASMIRDLRHDVQHGQDPAERWEKAIVALAEVVRAESAAEAAARK